MYARVTMAQFQPGTVDALIGVLEEVAPQLKRSKGFPSTQLLTDRSAKKGIAVTLYETLADLEASETFFWQSLADPRAAEILAEPTLVAVYEVAAQGAPAGAAAPASAIGKVPVLSG